jgi:hypothetical protein
MAARMSVAIAGAQRLVPEQLDLVAEDVNVLVRRLRKEIAES